ncbi:MAG: preprotein translocase subunit SecY [Clostridiales bacterium]|nr:preprotein translocase subunit SecY [Clostridiales bacterium]
MKGMFDTLVKAFQLPDLRKKILYTLLILAIYEVGGLIPVPGIDRVAFSNLITNNWGQIGQLMDIISGGGLYAATIFAMGISPYINASIIIQLLTVVIPALENLSKEGEAGRKKMTRITRYSAVGLAFLQSCLFCWSTRSAMVDSLPKPLNAALIVISFTVGTCLVVWLGERINEKGIGNGVSLIIFAGIVTRLPSMLQNLIDKSTDVSGRINPVAFGLLVGLLLFIAVALVSIVIIIFVVFVQNAERRIQVQYSKKTVGRKLYGGQSSYIPLKVNQSGVMPVIFAMSILSLPSMIVTLFAQNKHNLVIDWFRDFTGSPWYYLFYFLFIIAFTFFYSLIQFNPIEISNNIQKNGGFIPGIRPGKPTTEFIAKTANRLNWVDAFFLASVCLVPTLISALTDLNNVWFAGTSVLILTGVANDLVVQIEGQLVTRNYRGFLD